jgi:hypothetical protein
MALAEHIVERLGQLRADQAYWEGLRRQANSQLQERLGPELQEADIDRAAYVDNEQERLKSQLSTALFHLQEIAQEFQRIRQLHEAQTHEAAERDAARREEASREEAQREERLKEESSIQRDSELKDQLAKEDLEKSESFLREEQRKTEALEQERLDKELFAKKESDRLEALAKEERDRQEAEHRGKEQSDLELLADINEQWEYIQAQIATEWEYIDQQIHEEMEYNVAQALEAVAEAGFEIGLALANPLSQKETAEFLQSQKQQLDNLISDEVFQAAPSAYKEAWLADKFKEQLRAAEEQFGDRKDDWGNRQHLRESLVELHESARDAWRQEREIEQKLNADVEELKGVAAETKERMEAANLAEAVLEEKKCQADELAKKLEAQLRTDAEEKRQAIWEELQHRMREIEAQNREEAAREEARRREEASRTMRDAFGL